MISMKDEQLLNQIFPDHALDLPWLVDLRTPEECCKIASEHAG